MSARAAWLLVVWTAGCATSNRPASEAVVSPRALAVFRVGQLGVDWRPPSDAQRALTETDLLARLAGEKDPGVRDRIIEALGKVGGTPSVAPLAKLLAGPEATRAAIAIAMIAKRDTKLVPAEIINELDDLLDAKDAEVRWAAVYALGRLKREATRPLLLRGLGDRSPLVRATAAKFLADVPADGDEARLAPLLDDADVRVAAEAGRALARRAVRCDPARPCPAIVTLSSAAQFRAPVMAAIAFEPITHPRAKDAFKDRFYQYGDARIPDAAARKLAQCQAALAHDRVIGRADLLLQCGSGAVDESLRLRMQARALGEGGGDDDERLDALAELSKHSSAAVRSAAAEAMGKIAYRPAGEVTVGRHGARPSVNGVRLLELVGDEAPSVVAAAAEALAQVKPPHASQFLRMRLKDLSGPDAIEAQQAIVSALASLKAVDAVEEIRKLAHDTPYAVCLSAEQAVEALGQPTPCQPATPTDSPFMRDPLSSSPRVRIVTTQGTMHARLFAADAPSTVRNFLGLVRRHFFDGLAWHRVVPGFVSQGGDPKGDGSGGPGWTIPCEINPHRYLEGTLGMALSGRDTGGSQWFITHTPQPHLDGRYTAFGRLTEGLEVAVRLVEGDRIVEIREE